MLKQTNKTKTTKIILENILSWVTEAIIVILVK